MRSTFSTPIFLICTFTLFFAGVFRDDVKEDAHFKLAEEQQFKCVGRVYFADKPKSSCVLISTTHILVAAHTIYFSNTLAKKGLQADRTDISSFKFNFDGTEYKAKNIIHPPQNGQNSSDYDIAIVELDKPVDNITPAAINRSFDELNSRVVGVGFGDAGSITPKGFLKNEISGRRNAGENVIDKIGGIEFNNRPGMLYFDFDSPTNPSVSKMGSSTPLALEYCPIGGDSGGGLFIYKDKRWRLAGICHGTEGDVNNFMKNGYYGDVAAWIRVSVFANWIDEVTR